MDAQDDRSGNGSGEDPAIRTPVPAARRLALVVTPVAVLAVAAVVLMVVVLPVVRQRAVARWLDRVATVADDRVLAVERWVADERADAATLAAFPTAVYLLSDQTTGPYPFPVEEGPEGHLDTLLADSIERLGFRWAAITDTTGELRVAAGDLPVVDAALRDLAERVGETGEPTLRFDPGPGGGEAVMFAAPVVLPPMRPDAAGTTVGAVILGSDPNEWLFPFLTSSGAGLASLRTLLVSSTAAGVHRLFVGSRSTDVHPAVDTDAFSGVPLLEAAFAQGDTSGVYLAEDGTPVVAALRRVSGTPWILGASVDLDEALRPHRSRVVWTTVVAIALLAAAVGVGLGLWWRRGLREEREARRRLERQRRLESSLHRLEERLRAFVSSNVVGLFVADADGRVEEANDAVLRMTGWTAEEVASGVVSWTSMTSGEDRGLDEAAMAEAMERGASTPYEKRIISPSGSTRWVLAGLARAGSPEEPEVVGFTVDLTSAKEVEAALRRSEARYRALFESARDAVLLIEDGVFVDCNPAAERLFGRDRRGILGHEPGELSPDVQPDGEPSHRKAARLIEAALGGEPQRFEWIHSRPDGGDVITEIHLGRVPLPDRQLLQAMLRDVTGRRREDERRTRLAAAVEQAGEGIAVTDASLRIRYANPSYALLCGAPLEELDGRRLDLLDGDALTGDQHSELEAVLARGDEWRGRLSGTRRDGSPLVEDVTISPVRGADGEVVDFVVIRNDATHEEELTRQLVQAQKMEAVGRLAGGVAHDFNNLLSVILSYCGFVREAIPEGDPTRADVDEIASAAERATRLTGQLLAFSRRQVTRPEELDLNAVVGELEKMLRRMIGEDLALRTELAEDLGTVVADRGQIEQVLMNLAVNSRDAMPGGGELVVRTTNRTVGDEESRLWPGLKPGRYVTLEVRDTGQGMDAETLARVFEPFFTTKEQGKGTGLGLATVYGIVKQSNGYISVESRPGEGTTVVVSLPRRRKDDSSSSGHHPVLPEAGGGGRDATVLVVEDDAAVRGVVSRILRRAGLKVISCDGPGEAISLVQRHEGAIDVLLTDVVMPLMSGVELAERVSRARPGIQAMFMTGYSDERVQERLPGERVVRKPFAPEALVDMVRRVLQLGDDVADRGPEAPTTEPSEGAGTE